MTAYRLILHPRSATAAPTSQAELLHSLETIGLAGEPFDLDGRTHFHTGGAFLDHISFLGCSPAITLAAPATGRASAGRRGAFCHLTLGEITAAPHLRLRRGYAPRCRGCRGEITPEQLAVLSEPFRCPHCSQVLTRDSLNWRQAGGYARIFLEIWGIHPAEAVPTDGLLSHLTQFTECDWGFFYLDP